MNLERLLAKIHDTAKDRLGIHDDDDDCGCDVTSPEFQTQNILRLRNQVHEMDLEIMELKSELAGNKHLQQENESVKNAWEQYQIVLKLAKE